jgi:predicted rRNA methylase YqxC with S4 and FtsJ domains
VLEFAQELQFQISGLIRSPLLGPKGNMEFLAWFEWPGQDEVSVGPYVQNMFLNE